MVLGYLISPVVQIVDSHGKPIVGAKIYVYKAGTTNTVNTYRDFSNHYNTTPVLTDTLGNCTIIASDDMIYDIVVKDNRNNLLMSKDNLTVSSGINPDINLRFNEGYGIIIRKNGNTVTIAVDTDVVATKDDLATKQDKLTAGDNIDITDDNIINVVNRKTLYTQWPLKVDRGNSMVKLYLDQEFIDNADANAEILPGADLISYTDVSGRQVIGVDTNSSATGDYNFYVGYNNEINGNYNIIAGSQNKITNGNRNAVFGGSNSATGYSNIVAGYTNTVDGTGDTVFGQNNTLYGQCSNVFGFENTLSGNYSTVAGRGNTVSADSNTVIGEYATTGDYYFAVGNGAAANNRSNAFEVRKNGDIYYKYDNNMHQLKPLTSNGFAKKYTKSVTIDSNSTDEATIIFDNISDYKTWVSTGLITSPCSCRITVNAGRARNDVVSLYCEQYWVDAGRTSIFDSTGLRFVEGFIECGNYTFPCSNTLFTRFGDWNPGMKLIPRNGATFTVGDVITVELELHAVKLI